MWIGDVNIDSLLKAVSKFEQFRVHTKTEQERAGVIQAFEYCFELAWKTMKRLLEERGKIANSPKEAFRMAALEGFIKDPEMWFDFLRKRNITSDSYKETEAEKVLEICPAFSDALQDFLKSIGAFHHAN